MFLQQGNELFLQSLPFVMLRLVMNVIVGPSGLFDAVTSTAISFDSINDPVGRPAWLVNIKKRIRTQQRVAKTGQGFLLRFDFGFVFGFARWIGSEMLRLGF